MEDVKCANCSDNCLHHAHQASAISCNGCNLQVTLDLCTYITVHVHVCFVEAGLERACMRVDGACARVGGSDAVQLLVARRSVAAACQLRGGALLARREEGALWRESEVRV